MGQTYPASDWPVEDIAHDRTRFTSEGDWAFCRFESEAIPALRMGFQAGSFEIGAEDQPPDPERLQVHLEVMTAEGGLLWVPTSRFRASAVESAGERKDVRLAVDGDELLRMAGWPEMDWHLRSDDDELEVRLRVDLRSVTLLPDCLLPHVVFAMWEGMGRARGEVRVGDRIHRVDGRLFYDRTRVARERHAVPPRQRYLYTTLALEDGGGLFGYHAEDVSGAPMGYYCFGVLVEPDGRGTFLPNARLHDLELDADGIPARWSFTWEGEGTRVEVEAVARPLPLLRGWGGPAAPASRRGYVIFPVVFDATARVRTDTSERAVSGGGLAEYYDAAAWSM